MHILSGCLPIGLIAINGPQTGMRTMVITWYPYGYWGGSLRLFLNVLTQVNSLYRRFSFLTKVL